MIPWLNELYLTTLWSHLALVSTSVTLFAARGLGVLSGADWPMKAGWRRFSVVVDMGLLLAGGLLWWLMQHNPLREPWLAMKLTCLPLYVVLGSMALKRARSRGRKALFFLAALSCVLTMASMAWLRHPAGALSLLWS